ncbi:unnamed protein product [Effrenium voratum]|nr:unnamed protein product [Effrenium voratum]
MGTRLMGKLLLAAALHWRLSLADEDDTEVETCWLDDPLGSQSAWAQQCCRPRPCGREACWAPPTFTYEFCCEEAACRPLPVEEVKRALDAVVESLPNANASVLAFRTAPEAFRAMRRLESEGVQLVAEHQACACAIAYFAAALLWHAEDSPKLATAVGPRWFLFGIEWGNLLVEGWAGIFGWLDRFSAEEGVVPEPAEAELEKRRLDLMEVMRQEQAEAVGEQFCMI